jgi:hypothetical protein
MPKVDGRLIFPLKSDLPFADPLIVPYRPSLFKAGLIQPLAPKTFKILAPAGWAQTVLVMP